MQNHPISRRQFIERTAAMAGGVILSPLAARAAAKKTAVDIVPLGKTGLKACRLSFGCGTSSGRVQQELGQEGFNRLHPVCLRSGHHAHRHRPVVPDAHHARRGHQGPAAGEALHPDQDGRLAGESPPGDRQLPQDLRRRLHRQPARPLLDQAELGRGAKAGHGRHAGGQGQEDHPVPRRLVPQPARAEAGASSSTGSMSTWSASTRRAS